MDACSAPGIGFIGSVTGFMDCQAEVLGSGAWAALATPGSTLTIVLAGFLTIFVALIGYRLLLGQSFTVREATLSFVKMGAVFALATSWPAYRTVVYDLVTSGPAQLVREIGPRAGIRGADGTLVQRLDLADRALVQLAVLGPGNAPAETYRNVPPPPFIGFDAFALGGGRIVFLITSVASLGIVRLVTGMLLAVGPFFIAFLMFDSTRSLFDGWVRVLAGAALASFAVSVGLGLQLALLEPWLSAALARRMAGEALPTMPTELFVLTSLFAMVVLAAAWSGLRLAAAFRLAPRLALSLAGPRTQRVAVPIHQRATGGAAPAVAQSRAAATANIIASSQLRETRGLLFGAEGATGDRARGGGRMPTAAERGRTAVPLGRSFSSRRPGIRASARAAQRDKAQ